MDKELLEVRDLDIVGEALARRRDHDDAPIGIGLDNIHHLQYLLGVCHGGVAEFGHLHRIPLSVTITHAVPRGRNRRGVTGRSARRAAEKILHQFMPFFDPKAGLRRVRFAKGRV